MEAFAAKNAARELALSSCRIIIRLSANTIRAVHREDWTQARSLITEAEAVHRQTLAALDGHPAVYHAGFLHDAQKELAEAGATLALLSGAPLPTPEDMGVEDAAWLNGIAEAIGEMRRWILDRLRRGDYEACEPVLGTMDDIYAVLVTIDFPDALTGGLRRTTDQSRGILEKTRGDLTMAMVQREAIEAMAVVRSPTQAGGEMAARPSKEGQATVSRGFAAPTIGVVTREESST